MCVSMLGDYDKWLEVVRRRFAQIYECKSVREHRCLNLQGVMEMFATGSFSGRPACGALYGAIFSGISVWALSSPTSPAILNRQHGCPEGGQSHLDQEPDKVSDWANAKPLEDSGWESP